MKKLSLIALLLLALLLVAHAEDYDEEFLSNSFSISEIIPTADIWGLSSDDFQSAYPAAYTDSTVGKSPALIREDLEIEGYDMNSYYVFADGKLSKIAYILADDSDKSVVKTAAAELIGAMEAALDTPATEGKGVSEWNDGSIQIGTAKLKNYTGNDNLNACIIFKANQAANNDAKSSSKDDSVILSGNTDYVEVTDWAFVKGAYSTQLIVEFTNTGAESIPDMEVEMILYDKDGNILTSESDGHDVFLPGSTVVTQKSIYGIDDADLAQLKVIIDTEKYTNHYVNHVDNLDFKGSVNGNKVFLEVTNNDSDEIEEIEIVVVFYKDGRIVGADEKETHHLGSGKEYVFEFSGYEDTEADSYQYFVNQAHTF